MASEDDFREIAQARVRERSTRMLAAGVTVAVAYALHPSVWPLVWFAAVSLAQIPDAIAFKPFVTAGAPVTPAARRRCAMAAGLSTTIYSSIAGYVWLAGGLAARSSWR